MAPMATDGAEKDLRIKLEGHIEHLEAADRTFLDVCALLKGPRWREQDRECLLLKRAIALYRKLPIARGALLRFRPRASQREEKLLKRFLKQSDVSEKRLQGAVDSALAINGERVPGLDASLERILVVAGPASLAPGERVVLRSAATITAYAGGGWFAKLGGLGGLLLAKDEPHVPRATYPTRFRGRLRLTQWRVIYEDPSRALVFSLTSAQLKWEPGDDDFLDSTYLDGFLLQMPDVVSLALRWPILQVDGFDAAEEAWAKAGHPDPQNWPPRID